MILYTTCRWLFCGPMLTETHSVPAEPKVTSLTVDEASGKVYWVITPSGAIRKILLLEATTRWARCRYS